MTQQLFACITHKNGAADDAAFELPAAAQKIFPDAPVTAIVWGQGAELDSVCKAVGSLYAEIWKIDNDAFAYPNAEVIRPALAKILPVNALLLMPHDTFGMDLGPGLAVKLDAAYVSDVVGFDGTDGASLKIVRQEYGGQVSTHVTCDISSGAVITVRPGSFPALESGSAAGAMVDKSADAGVPAAKRQYVEVVAAEVGDVDITKSEILVAVGRGIEDQDNLEIVHELAEAMGGDVACSRPIVDAKWLEKSRQVGTSGQTVKPKVYVAAGISGSFQHMGGIKGSPFIVAINKNAKAPIFQMADVGVVANMLEFLPELTEKVKELK